MRLPLGKQRRRMLSRKIRDFWVDYKRNKIGLFGLAIFLIFVFIAGFASWLTPYDPTRDYDLADSMAMPGWMTVFPQYSDLPQTVQLQDWPETVSNQSCVEIKTDDESVVVQYQGGNARIENVYLIKRFNYSYTPPTIFKCIFEWSAAPEPSGELGYSLELLLFGPNGENNSLWDSKYGVGEKYTTEIPFSTTEKQYAQANIFSKDSRLLNRFGYKTIKELLTHNLATELFEEKGEYCLFMHIGLQPASEEASCEITLKHFEFRILGHVWGILGTDRDGRDVFSQLIYGSQISLGTGLLAALLLAVIGVVVGVVSGYRGGVVDELLMRATDIFLSIPLLALFVTLILVFGRNILYIILVIGFFSWPQVARVIRSQVLSLREQAFIESAMASGASRSYIMLHHILPNVLPIVFAAIVLNIPLAILSEASLSFIGLGDPSVATWGRMLNRAFQTRAFENMAWWWIIPPGLAIMTLSISFVFIGHAVDEIVNPRLRRRR